MVECPCTCTLLLRIFKVMGLSTEAMKRTILLATLMIATAAMSHAQDLPDYVPANGLIGWWPFSGDPNDASGNANHGITMGGVSLTNDRFGAENSAYSFPGNLASFIEVELNETADSLVSGITMSAWYLTDATTGDRRLLQIGNTDSGGRGLMVMLTNGEPWATRVHSGFVATQAGRIGGWPTAAESIKNEWTHLVFTANFVSGQWRVYQNGALQSQGTTQNPIGFDPLNLSDLPFNIGVKAPFGFFQTDAWTGSIDDIGLWRRVLNDCEIFDLFSAELDALFVTTADDFAVCPEEEVELFATTNGTLSWNVGNESPIVITEPTTFVATSNVGACQVSDTLTIDVLQPTFGTDSLQACESFTWIDGITYTESNDTAQWVLTNAAGCDSVVTLALDILQPIFVSQVVKACDTYTWVDGNTYTSSTDTANFVFSSVAGCDSIVTLLLTIDSLQIINHPVDQTVTLLGGAEFTLTTSATEPSYQWQSDFGNGFIDLEPGGQYAGVESAILSVIGSTFDNDQQPFRCVVMNGACSDTTEVAFLYVCGSLTLQPLDQQVPVGSDATFTVESNDLSAAFQWQSNIGFGFQDLSDAGQYSGTNTPTLTVSNVNEGNENQLFRCVLLSGSCTRFSDEATLTIGEPVHVPLVASTRLRVWPNPTRHSITIEANSAEMGQPIALFDLNGRMLHQEQVTSTRTVLDLSDLAPGVYFISLGAPLRQTMRVIKH